MGQENGPPDPRDRRLQLQIQQEKLRLQCEELKLKRESSGSRSSPFLSRHFGSVLTAGVALIAVVVAYSQTVLQEREAQRNAGEFVLEHRDVIFNGSAEEQELLRDVMEKTIPEEIFSEVAVAIQRQARSAEVMAVWTTQEARPAGPETRPGGQRAKPTRMFVHYSAEEDAETVDGLIRVLRGNRYPIPGKELVAQETDGDIRYFHETDKAIAVQAKKIVESWLGERGIEQEVTVIGLVDQYPNVPRGVLELWLPALQEGP